ncbi:MAG: acyl-CoA thioesterase [Mucilaginibacter sp.]|uniref:acyl-CoA thioesterase n=1 Tax=Mucilaginibacter sp. TaxID=1882438 RepID=UPI0031A38085
MEKILSSCYKVRFQDCDPFNHLNNASYINYFLNAREDHLLENYNFDVFEKLRTDGQSWVVASSQICYLNPANVAETVIIESQLMSFTSKSVNIEMRMWSQGKIKLKALLWTTFIYFDIHTQKATNHPVAVTDLLNSILLPIEQNSFEERRNSLMRRVVA